MDLLTEVMKAQDNLQDIKFEVNGTEFVFYFRYLTLLEKVRVEQMCIRQTTTVDADGVQHHKAEKQDHLIPIHTIIEKALDEDGKRLFSHTKKDDFKAISMLPAGYASVVAYEMSRDFFGTMKPKESEDGTGK